MLRTSSEEEFEAAKKANPNQIIAFDREDGSKIVWRGPRARELRIPAESKRKLSLLGGDVAKKT